MSKLPEIKWKSLYGDPESSKYQCKRCDGQIDATEKSQYHAQYCGSCVDAIIFEWEHVDAAAD